MLILRGAEMFSELGQCYAHRLVAFAHRSGVSRIANSVRRAELTA
jgi:hypothetical protein